MRLLADLHISPQSVIFVRSLGHEIVRINEIVPATTSDKIIIQLADQDRRVILTQDLDFSDIIALSGYSFPSVISLRLHSSRIENVNGVLQKVLPLLEEDVKSGMLVTVEDHRIRRRQLPIT